MAAPDSPSPIPSAARAPQRRAGTLTRLVPLAPDLWEATVGLTRPLDHRPGQSVSLSLGEDAPRDLHPTLRLEAATELNELVFHLPAAPGAPPPAALGTLARVRGPSGEAYHRPGLGRLILVATRGGFAPLWAIARATRCREPERETLILIGARTGPDLYMRESLAWLAGTGAQVVTSCATAPARGDRTGPVTAHLPRLGLGDTVHALGHPRLVAAVARLARDMGAECRAEALAAAPRERSSCAVIALDPLRARQATLRRGAA